MAIAWFSGDFVVLGSKAIATNKSKSVQTNTPNWSTPTDTTGDVAALRTQAQTGFDYSVPVNNQFARAEQQLDRSYNNPLGAFSNPDVADKAKRSQQLELGQNKGMALAEAGQASNQAKFGQMSTVAGLTQPRMYMEKSQTSNPFVGGDVVDMIIGGGNAAMM